MCNILDLEGELTYTGMIHPRQLDRNQLYHPAVFCDKTVYEKVGSFDLRYQIASDYDFILRCREKRIQFVPVYNILTNYTEGGASTTFEAVYDKIKVQLEHKLISRGKYVLRLVRYKCFELLSHGK